MSPPLSAALSAILHLFEVVEGHNALPVHVEMVELGAQVDRVILREGLHQSLVGRREGTVASIPFHTPCHPLLFSYTPSVPLSSALSGCRRSART